MGAIKVEATAIPDVRIITPRKIGDQRGFFSETYNKLSFAEAGIYLDFVQDNHSVSRPVGTIRGLHFQSPPFAQDKLVRVTRGRIFDVVVDLRRSSSNFGRHVVVEMSSENWAQLLVPIGFAHGFCTLEPDTEVIYKVTNFYSAADDRGVVWDDPDLAIEWPVERAKAVLSDKDVKLPRFAELPVYFE